MITPNMTDWSQTDIMKFLELYKNERVIWDPKHSEYNVKSKKLKAWVRLGIAMKCSIDDLKRKKNSLMATFRGLLRKKRAAIADNDFSYQPGWFAYDFLEEFLEPVTAVSSLSFNAGQTMPFDFGDEATEEPSLSGLSNEEIIDADDSELISKNDLVLNFNTFPEESAAPEDHTTEQSDPELPEPEIQISKSYTMKEEKKQPNCDCFGEMSSRKSRKPKGVKRPKQQIDDIESSASHEPAEDPLDVKTESFLFCEFLRFKLNALDEDTRQVAMNKIDNLMFSLKKPKIQIKVENEFSPSASPVNNHLPTHPPITNRQDITLTSRPRLKSTNGWFQNKN